MSAKHTPGPWVTDPEGHIRAPYPNHAPGISIARMTCFGAHDVHMAMGANAALISAAPDLLAALEELLVERYALEEPEEFDADGRWTSSSPASVKARAAILKAKGEA